MNVFNLDPDTVMPWDIIGCILFPDDEEMALLSAVNDLIHFRASNIKMWEMLNWPPKEQKRSKDGTWKLLHQELDKHGGLDTLIKLLEKEDFHKKYRQAIIEGQLAGMILMTAFQISAAGEKLTRKNTFMIVEEKINRNEAEEGGIYFHGERISVKRSEKRLYDCWRRRSCVAHWWLAFEVMDAFEDELQKNIFLMDNVPALIATAYKFLEFGAMIAIRNQNGKWQPFLNPEEAWVIGKIRGTYPGFEIKVKFPPLPDWATDLIGSNQ